jgi:hypothetical protein
MMQQIKLRSIDVMNSKLDCSDYVNIITTEQKNYLN